MRRNDAGDLVGRCASLAALLEVSAYPKPGNVHRTRDFPGTRFEHFLAGGVAMAPEMSSLAMRGYDVARGSLDWGSVEVGRHARMAVADSLSWQTGGNVNLGVVLLFSPLAAAAGATLMEKDCIEAEDLRRTLGEVIRSTTPEDAIHVYEAIQGSMTPQTLGEADELDVTDDESRDRIRREGLTLLDVFQICAERDSICGEWVSGFQITFEVGHTYLKSALELSGDTNTAVVDTFLHILAERPDSLIARKAGGARAEEVSSRAGLILEEGGSGSEGGLEMLWELDGELQTAGGALNPGTTADLTAASLFVTILEGWRP